MKNAATQPAVLHWPGKTQPGFIETGTEGLNRSQFKIGHLGTEQIDSCLIHGDNLAVMHGYRDLLRGKIKLIYIDPPFNTAHSFFTSQRAKNGDRSKQIAYSDRWSSDGSAYLQFLWVRLQLMHSLLSDDGSLYIHCDYRATAHIKLMLEEIFGPENYINECIWYYRTGGNAKSLGFARKHDTVHFVAKNREKAVWNKLQEKSYLKHKYGFKNINLSHDEGGTYNMVTMRDVWDLPALRGNQPERVNYPTQKPEGLLERIILSSTHENDLVADFFCGSGTTGVVAQKLNRRWLLVDSGDIAVKTSATRLSALLSKV